MKHLCDFILWNVYNDDFDLVFDVNLKHEYSDVTTFFLTKKKIYKFSNVYFFNFFEILDKNYKQYLEKILSNK